MKKLKFKGNNNTLLIAGGALAACAVGAALYLRGRNGSGAGGEGTSTPFMSFNTDGSAPFSVHNALIASLGGPWFGPKLPTFGEKTADWDGTFGVNYPSLSYTMPSTATGSAWTSATGGASSDDGSAPFGTRYTLDVMAPATY